MYLKQNLYKNEKHIRLIIGITLVLSSVYFDLWWLIIFAILAFATSSYNYCPLYDLSGINEDKAKHNYYLSQFPIYNPEPALLITKNGSVDFKNASAAKVFNSLDSIDEILPKDQSISELIENNKSAFNNVTINELSYIVHFKGISEINAVLAFSFNITDIVKMNEEIVNTQKDIVYKMGEIGETRSKETGNHVKRVAEYSYLLAQWVGLDEEEAEILKIASPMHDIGKVGIPDEVLKKPGRFNEEEREIMNTHATIGYEMLKHSDRPILKAAAIVAHEHHERWDGNGYPNKTSGEEIHIYGRITAIADVFDALGSKRVYKDAWELDRILSLFKEERGKQFDPQLVDLLFENLDKFIEIRDKYTDID